MKTTTQFHVEDINTKSIIVIGGEDFCRHRCDFANAVYNEPKFKVVPHVTPEIASRYMKKIYFNKHKDSQKNPLPLEIPVTTQSRVKDYLKFFQTK